MQAQFRLLYSSYELFKFGSGNASILDDNLVYKCIYMGKNYNRNDL